MTSRQVWWYARQGVKYGPMSGRELKAIAAAGGLSAHDKVWKVGLTRWVDATAVKGLLPAATLAEVPPPLPPAPSAPAVTPAPEPKVARPKKPAPSTKEAKPAAVPTVRSKGTRPVIESKRGAPWSPPKTSLLFSGWVDLDVPEDLLGLFVGSEFGRYYEAKWYPPEAKPQADAAKASPSPAKKLSKRLPKQWTFNQWGLMFGFLWLAYRRIYEPLLLGLVSMAVCLVMAVVLTLPSHQLALLLMGVLVLAHAACGVLGNQFYLRHAALQIRALTSRRLSEDVLQIRLRHAGGVSWLMPITVLLGLTLGIIGLVLGSSLFSH